jgi:hypothetical protein
MGSPRDKVVASREKTQRKLEGIFEDIDPDESPLAYSVRARARDDEFLIGVIDGLVHAVAALEKHSLAVAARSQSVRSRFSASLYQLAVSTR